MKQHKAIFLDRDGVINIDKNYLYKIEDFEFIDGVIEALQYLAQQGYLLFIITNQSGINRGYYTIDDFNRLTNWMLAKLQKYNINISQVEFCPHTPNDNCDCRKPKTKMIVNIMKNFDINLDKSWLIGDKISDILCAKNANIKNTIQIISNQYNQSCNTTYSIERLDIKNIKNIKGL